MAFKRRTIRHIGTIARNQHYLKSRYAADHSILEPETQLTVTLDDIAKKANAQSLRHERKNGCDAPSCGLSGPRKAAFQNTN